MTPTSVKLNRADLIAPCGINCRLCRAYGRERNPCAGCRARRAFTASDAFHCSVHCEVLATSAVDYCFQCEEYPCRALLHLDKRYRTRYQTSPIDNLESIQAHGIRHFIRSENQKWTCPQCGAMLCMHMPDCPSCGHAWRQVEA
jgi:hypothetical protein